MKKISLPSLKGEHNQFNREKCLAVVLVTLLLATVFMSAFAFNNYKVYAAISSPKNSECSAVGLEPDAAQKEDNLTILINDYIAKLEEQGYANIFYVANPDIEYISGDDNSVFLDNIVFYTEYTVLKFDKDYYFFKSNEDADKFIEKLFKYGKQNYEKFDNVREQIAEETSEEQLENIILAKKIAAEQAKKRSMTKKVSRSGAIRTVKAEAAAPTYSGDVTGQMIADYAVKFVGNSYV